MKFLLFCLTLVPFFSSCQRSTPKEVKKKTIIYEALMDLNDLNALYFLAVNPNVNLAGVTITGSDLHYFKNAAKNAKDLLLLANKPSVPVSTLIAKTFCNPEKLPYEWTQIESIPNLDLYHLPTNNEPPLDIQGDDLIIDIIKKSKDMVTVVSVGSLNNIARALEKDPSIKNNIEEIVISTGAIHIAQQAVLPFSLNYQEGTSYDVFLDPCSAEILFQSKIKITLIPLSICILIPNNLNLIKNTKIIPSSVATFPLQVLKNNNLSENNLINFSTFWDIAADMAVTNPELFTFKTMKVNVIKTQGSAFGNVIPEDSGYPINICTDVNRNAFYKTYFSMLHE